MPSAEYKREWRRKKGIVAAECRCPICDKEVERTYAERRKYCSPECKREGQRRATQRWRDSHSAEHQRAIKRRAYGIKDAPGELKAGPCEICNEHCDRLDCDHDRASGEFRGWLCPACNKALGGFKDDPRRLMAAVVYLKKT